MQTQELPPFTLPATTTVGQVTLRVGNLERSLAFYRDILGYTVKEVSPGVVRLYADPAGPHHFELRETPGAQPAPRRATGLYHAAILMPTRHDLALITRRLAEHGIGFGQGDHGVSEALYLDDPDANGLEIYADRPHEQWPIQNGQVMMGTDPIDFQSLLGELSEGDDWEGLPAQTTIGHVHLKVSDIAEARRFYADVLGFDVMLDAIPSALFMSAGGYHHHLGANTWESRGANPAGPEFAGLVSFAVELPDQESRDALVARLTSAGVQVSHDGDTISLPDMDGDRVVLTTGRDDA